MDSHTVKVFKPNKAQHHVANELLTRALLEQNVPPWFLESTAFKAYVTLWEYTGPGKAFPGMPSRVLRACISPVHFPGAFPWSARAVFQHRHLILTRRTFLLK
jgi:hypothetical protein